MPIIRLKEIKSMSAEDKSKKLSELRTELARMKTMVHAGGTVENPTKIYELRKTIAQILTIQNEESRKAASEAPKKKAAKKETKAKEKKETKA